MAWRRDTVTSSRNRSESGWRPMLVAAASRAKVLPAFGPRRTTNIPRSGGRSSRRWPSSASSSWRSSSSPSEAVVSSASPSDAPHEEQKFAPGSLSWPQRRHSMPPRVPTPPRAFNDPGGSAGLDELLVGRGVHERVELGGVRERDREDPALPVGVLVEELGSVVQPLVHRGDL